MYTLTNVVHHIQVLRLLLKPQKECKIKVRFFSIFDVLENTFVYLSEFEKLDRYREGEVDIHFCTARHFRSLIV